MDLDSKLGGEDVEDRILLVTDAATGPGSMLTATGRAIPGVSLAIEGRTTGEPIRTVRWDYLLDRQKAMALTGLLFDELDPSEREILVGLWRSRGMGGL